MKIFVVNSFGFSGFSLMYYLKAFVCREKIVSVLTPPITVTLFVKLNPSIIYWLKIPPLSQMFS